MKASHSLSNLIGTEFDLEAASVLTGGLCCDPHRGWFDLPAQQITPEVKRDLRLIRLRGAMDTKRFYKSLDSTKFPKYFQFGTVVEGPADFYAGATALP